VSRSFLPAERAAPSASKAWARWSGESDFWVLFQVQEARTAVVAARSRWALVGAAGTVKGSARSRSAVIGVSDEGEGLRTTWPAARMGMKRRTACLQFDRR
jgi:hypothetical protein